MELDPDSVPPEVLSGVVEARGSSGCCSLTRCTIGAAPLLPEETGGRSPRAVPPAASRSAVRLLPGSLGNLEPPASGNRRRRHGDLEHTVAEGRLRPLGDRAIR